MNRPTGFVPAALGLLTLYGACTGTAQELLSSLDPVVLAHAQAGPRVTVIEPNAQVWEEVRLVGDDGFGWRVETNVVVELSPGIGRWDSDSGRYVPAIAEFETAESGHFVARKTQLQAILDPDLASAEGAVDLLTPDGVRLRFRPFGIAVLDTASGQSYLLAEIISGTPVWAAPGEVVYENAMDGLRGSLRYRLSLAGIEQDVLLEEQIAPEVLDELGLDPATCRVLIMTECLSSAAPVQDPIGVEVAPGERRQAAILSFGAMSIGVGSASALDEDLGANSILVLPSWEEIESRQFLIESVDYLALAPLLENLPAPDQARVEALKAKMRRTASLNRLPLPVARDGVREARRGGPEFREGQLAMPESGRRWARAETKPPRGRRALLWDWALEISSGQSNYTFKGDQTYYISAAVPLTGTTCFHCRPTGGENRAGPLDFPKDLAPLAKDGVKDFAGLRIGFLDD